MMLYEMINKKASVMGIEPTTFGLGGRCSTIELHGLCLLVRPRCTFILIPFSPLLNMPIIIYLCIDWG